MASESNSHGPHSQHPDNSNAWKNQTSKAKRQNRQKRASQKSNLASSFERLEPRHLLAGVTFLDSFVTDTIGTAPAIQAGDIGTNWTIVGSPDVGTGSATSGTAAPRDVDIGGSSQWVRAAGSGESAAAVFAEQVSLNGSTVSFDVHGLSDSTSVFSSTGVFLQGEAGNLFRLEFTVNDNAASPEISVPFEIIVNGQSTGVSGLSGDAWFHVEVTLNSIDWDLTWQQYDDSAGETTTLIGPVSTLSGLDYLTGAGGNATSVTFTDDGDHDGVGDAVMFFSNVEVVDANDAPEALNDFVTTDINTAVTFNVLTNDVDDDNLVISSFSQTVNGTLVDNGGGSFTYTPGLGFIGSERFTYTIDDGSGTLSTATAYLYTSDVLGLPAYATNPNAPAVLYLDFDGALGDDPFDRNNDLTVFNAFEQDLIRQSVEYIEQSFAMFDVNVTTVLTPDLPKAWMRIRSNGSGGAAYVGSFPNSQSRGYVSSSDRNLTTGLAHEFGHILNVTHQSTFDLQGNQVREYRTSVDGEGSIMGVDFAGNVVKWWWGHYRNQPTQLQDDFAKITTEIKNNSGSSTGYMPDDHASAIAFATPAELSGGVWSATGVINSLDDVDTFVFDWTGGDVEVDAFRTDPFTNSNRGDPSSVDIVLAVFDLDGNLLGYSDPDSFNNNSGLDASVTIPGLAAGSYIISVSSHGDYADMGVYNLTAQSGSWGGSNPSVNGLAAPTMLNVDWRDSTSATISWTDIAGETGFSVERSTNGVDFAEIGTTSANIATYSDYGTLEPGTQYYYRVRSKLNSTVSAASRILDVATRPGGVINLTVSDFVGTSKVLDWKVQRTSGETGFRIERSTDRISFSSLATVSANRPSYTDSGLDTNTTYYYRVVTLDSLGDAATTMASDSSDGLIARYTFNDSSARDSSLYGNDNSGTLRSGATTTFDSTRNSKVLSLDGTNDHITIADSSNINLGTHSDRTISVAFKADTTSGQQVIYEEGGATSGYNLYIDSGLLYVGAWGMNNGVANVFLSTAILANQWYNVSLVNDSIASTVTGYLNGTVFGSAASDSMPEHSGDIGIGRIDDATKTHSGNINSSGNHFAGLIDDVLIYNTAITGNTAPVTTNDSVIVDNDESVIISVLANDSDAEGHGLSVTSATQGSNGAVVVNDNGTITYTPNTDYFGNDSFTYIISDNQGGTDSATVNLTINSTGLVAQYTFDDGTASDVSTKGRDNSGTLGGGASIVSDSLRGNVLSLDGVNDYVAIPTSQDINNFVITNRTIFVSFKADLTSGRQVVYEEGGATRGFNIYIDSGLLYVGAWGITDADDIYLSRPVTAGEWNHVAVQLDGRSEQLTATLNGYVIGTAAAGKVTSHTGRIGIGRADNATRFHDGNFSGEGHYFGGLVDNLRIHNSSVENTLPVTTVDNETTDEDNAVDIDLTANDTDADGDALEVTSFTQGSNGTVAVADSIATYTPNLHFNGSDSFTYTVEDGFGGVQTETVNITVNSINDAPTDIELSNSTVTENSDTSVALVVGQLSATDVDSTVFTYNLIAGAGDTDNGDFEISGDELQIKPGTEIDFESQSQYSIRVEVSDGTDSYEQVFTIDVTNQLEISSPIEVGDGTATRSIVDKLVIELDDIVTIQPGAFVVTNKDTQANVPVVASIDDSSGKSVITLTFTGPQVELPTGSLVDGNYELQIDGSKIESTATGQLLDADNDGSEGGVDIFGDNATDKFFRLFGDFTGDRTVGVLDLFHFRSAYRASDPDPKYNAEFDYNGDGTVNVFDLFHFRQRYGDSI